MIYTVHKVSQLQVRCIRNSEISTVVHFNNGFCFGGREHPNVTLCSNLFSYGNAAK